MFVESLAESLDVLDSPPPETVAVLVSGVPALEATLTVSVMGFMLEPEATVLVLVQVRVPNVQLQPVPDMEVAVSPEGRLSVTVTVPDDVPVPTLETLSV